LQSRENTAELPFAKLDFGRESRTGFGETVFGAGKTCEQLAQIFAAFAERKLPCLATRCTAEQAAYLEKRGVRAKWDAVSRTIVSLGFRNRRRRG